MSTQALLPVKLTRQVAHSNLPLPENVEKQFSSCYKENRENIWINYTQEKIDELLEKLREDMIE